MKQQIKKAVLAYSGGLYTSIIIPWLKENYGCEVVVMVGYVGQEDELQGIEEKALGAGASKVFVEDLRQEFITDYLWPLVKSGARYEGSYLLGTAIAQPLLAKRLVDIALEEGADALAHGCTGKSNDQARFELTFKTFAPGLRIVAPWREWDIHTRAEAIAYAKARNIPVVATPEKIYSHDSNVWHVSHEGGVLEDTAVAPPEDVFELILDPRSSPPFRGPPEAPRRRPGALHHNVPGGRTDLRNSV